jgi:phage terminase Nu1 subunit (DNA packaging protein)
MAVRKPKTDPMLKSEEISEIPSTSPSDESATPMTKREAAKARCVSLKQAAALLNRDRNTLMKYLDQGMPFVEKADRDRGVSWVLDISDVVRWLEERAAKNVADRLGGSDGQVSKEESERRDSVAKMIIREADAAETIKLVAKIYAMLDLVRKDYTEIRLRFMAVPETIAGKVDPKVSTKVRDIATEQIRLALNSLTADATIENLAKG